MQTVYPALLAFFGLHLVILAHELGHYIVGRYFSLAMPRFTVGVGPRLLHWQFGETEFVWRLFPILGGVHIFGILGIEHNSELRKLCQEEELRTDALLGILTRIQHQHDEPSARGDDTVRADLLAEYEAQSKPSPLLDPKRHFNNRSGWVQLAVVLAGPAASVALAFGVWLVLAVAEYRTPTIFLSWGPVEMVSPDSMLGKQGVQKGDLAFAETQTPGIDWSDLTFDNSSNVRIYLAGSRKIVHPDLHRLPLLLGL